MPFLLAQFSSFGQFVLVRTGSVWVVRVFVSTEANTWNSFDSDLLNSRVIDTELRVSRTFRVVGNSQVTVLRVAMYLPLYGAC